VLKAATFLAMKNCSSRGEHFHGLKLIFFLAREGKIQGKQGFDEGQVKKQGFL